MRESILTKNQVRTISKNITYNGHQRVMTVTLRYDDRCNNGHNTFSITGDISKLMGGCIHDEIREFFPELAKYIKWDLCSSNGPLYYIANTLYHASVSADLDAARYCAIWPEANLEDFTEENLLKRLPALIQEFSRDMEELGFIF